MSEPVVTPLTLTQLLPIIVHAEARQRQTKRGSLLVCPCPPCPTCEAEPAEMVDASGPNIGLGLRVLFKPCGHQFTADEQTVHRAWDAAETIVDERENRPAGTRADAPCPRLSREEEHDAHNWYAPVEGPARCPGWNDRSPTPLILQRPSTRLYETRTIHGEVYIAEGNVIEHSNGWLTLWADTGTVALRLPETDIRAVRHITDDELDAIADDATQPPSDEQLATDLNEARMWARHGYEIGQRHCGWTDHGVAPAWLTEGWPARIGTCDHLRQAAGFDTALSRVRSLPTEPEVMDAQEPDAGNYLHGYRDAIADAKRAAWLPATDEPTTSKEQRT
jgi:hypothetical protein